ncbi:MAG: isoprenylcysteine carboxylmethyltransferase family protein [Anaerolineae bacterium]|nr:isoprenylcysteine carboxylmethyltransferase family protein [Anaerolineae bacterium]
MNDLPNANYLLFFLLFVAWAVLHSVMAAIGLKRLFRNRFGEAAYTGWYRLLYNLFSLVTFLPLYWLIPVLLPQTVVWSWSRPYLYLAYFLQLTGLVGLAYSLWLTDIWDFLGVRQALWFVRSTGEGKLAEMPSPRFITNGPYALVRHPLYFFSLLLLWFNPVMTVASLMFYTAVTLYFWLGSIYEEKKLAAGFGEAYHTYQQRVPRLFPIRLQRPQKPSF